eukprot:1158510-Pelagomonas_calceolata.AAC.8
MIPAAYEAGELLQEDDSAASQSKSMPTGRYYILLWGHIRGIELSRTGSLLCAPAIDVHLNLVLWSLFKCGPSVGASPQCSMTKGLSENCQSRR